VLASNVTVASAAGLHNRRLVEARRRRLTRTHVDQAEAEAAAAAEEDANAKQQALG
jgi:hypothetical protein